MSNFQYGSFSSIKPLLDYHKWEFSGLFTPGALIATERSGAYLPPLESAGLLISVVGAPTVECECLRTAGWSMRRLSQNASKSRNQIPPFPGLLPSYSATHTDTFSRKCINLISKACYKTKRQRKSTKFMHLGYSFSRVPSARSEIRGYWHKSADPPNRVSNPHTLNHQIWQRSNIEAVSPSPINPVSRRFSSGQRKWIRDQFWQRGRSDE